MNSCTVSYARPTSAATLHFPHQGTTVIPVAPLRVVVTLNRGNIFDRSYLGNRLGKLRLVK